MPRTFRFFVKKRGARRTDSSQLGNLALALFFGVMFFCGLGFSAFLLSTLVVPEWRVNHRFVEGECVVLGKRLRERVDGSQKTYRPELLIAYEVDGVAYQSRTYDIARTRSSDRSREEALLAAFEEGQRYPCWYDPNDPDTVVVARGYTWPEWALLLVPLSFVAAGGVGLGFALLRWGMSAERRAALAQKTIKLELADLAGEPANPFPYVPRGAMQSDSPGTRLAFRLRIDPQHAWALMALSGISLTVLVLASVFVWMALSAHLSGHPDWFLAVFASSWVVVGTGGMGYCLRQFIGAAGLGPTILEVSDHPLRSGEEYEVSLSQAGRVRIEEFELLLKCDERATYQQGTNTRSETCCVYQEQLLRADAIRLRRGHNFESVATFRIPLRQMHSFVSVHNEVLWTLRVTGRIPGATNFERRFRVVVYPPREEGIES